MHNVYSSRFLWLELFDKQVLQTHRKKSSDKPAEVEVKGSFEAEQIQEQASVYETASCSTQRSEQKEPRKGHYFGPIVLALIFATEQFLRQVN